MRKALVVGVDDYEQCPLYGCCNDADDIANTANSELIIIDRLHSFITYTSFL